MIIAVTSDERFPQNSNENQQQDDVKSEKSLTLHSQENQSEENSYPDLYSVVKRRHKS